MTAVAFTPSSGPYRHHHSQQDDLLRGEVLIETHPHSAWGGAVSAQMYLPLERSRVWQQLTDYPRWIDYFPDLVQSEVLSLSNSTRPGRKRLYQVARKAFLLFTAQVEAYLQVFESVHRQIQFRLEKGNFTDFAADLTLQDWHKGTLLTYTVQATPDFPVPSVLIQQAMQLELPTNMRTMRQVLCTH